MKWTGLEFKSCVGVRTGPEVGVNGGRAVRWE